MVFCMEENVMIQDIAFVIFGKNYYLCMKKHYNYSAEKTLMTLLC